MKAANRLALIVGYVVIGLFMAGAFGMCDFQIRLSREPKTISYTCEAGDSLFTRRKYVCGAREWADQQNALSQKAPRR